MSSVPKNGSDDKKSTTPDSSALGDSSHEPEPQPKAQPVVTSSDRLKADQDPKPLSPDSASQSESDPEYTHAELDAYDPECAKREFARRAGKRDVKLLVWEVLSKQHLSWFKRIDKQGLPPPMTASLDECQPSSDFTYEGLSGDQKKWLRWALNQEASEIRGGILIADDSMKMMTQAISLVVTAPDHKSAAKSEGSSSSVEDNKGGTLVICTKDQVRFWEGKIQGHTVKGSVEYLTLDEEKRKPEELLSKYKLVIATYHYVISDYKRFKDEEKAKEENKREDQARKKAKIMGSTNLVDYSWERILLQEPNIKTRDSITTRAVCALTSNYKWVLTSTLVQQYEKRRELQAMVRFLRLTPFTFYFCGDCDCNKQLDDAILSSTEKCGSCDHSGVRHSTWWEKYIEKGNQADKVKLLHKEVLKSVVLIEL